MDPIMIKDIRVLLVTCAVLVGGSALLNERRDSDDRGELLGRRTAEGSVVDVDLDGVALDRPALVTIQTTSGLETIALASFGLPLCRAAAHIASFGAIDIGDRVAVEGEINEAGNIAPCQRASDFLRVDGTVRNLAVGYEFQYRKGPTGYVVREVTEGADVQLVSGLFLLAGEGGETFVNSTTQGRVAMEILVYRNPENLSAFVWPERNPVRSNLELSLGESEEGVVGGANASYYRGQAFAVYVVAHGGFVFVLKGWAPFSEDFQSMVSSLSFIPTRDRR